MRIACLHTADSNVAVFEAALRGTAATGRPVTLTHSVRAELLREAEVAGGLTDGIATRAVAHLVELARGADGVLLTCSTLGPAAEAAATLVRESRPDRPVLRVDAALAQAAVTAAGDGRLVVLYAVETTLEPTRRLFEATPDSNSGRIAYRLVEGAWARFRAGDRDGYLRAIAGAADAAYANGARTVALAQASMAPAATLCARGRPLTSPGAGLAAIQAAVDAVGR